MLSSRLHNPTYTRSAHAVHALSTEYTVLSFRASRVAGQANNYYPIKVISRLIFLFSFRVGGRGADVLLDLEKREIVYTYDTLSSHRYCRRCYKKACTTNDESSQPGGYFQFSCVPMLVPSIHREHHRDACLSKSAAFVHRLSANVLFQLGQNVSESREQRIKRASVRYSAFNI